MKYSLKMLILFMDKEGKTMKKIALLLFIQLAWFESFAATGGAGTMPREEEIPPAVGGARAAPRVIPVLGLYSIDEITGDFPERLRTSISVVAITTRNQPDAYSFDAYSFNITALAFKVSLPEDRDEPEDGGKVLWYMLVRFLPQTSLPGVLSVVDSKVDAKLFYSPDTYRRIYGVDCPDIRFEEPHGTAFFRISGGLDPAVATKLKSRTIFEWPVVKRFPVDSFGDLRLVAAGREFNHVTPKDIINGLNTLRTRSSEGHLKFPFYTLRGMDYYNDAINNPGFCTRALNAFGLPIDTSPVLKAYLNHDYAKDYRWYKLGRLAFMVSGPKFLTPERFIQEIRKLFIEDGRPTHGCREGDRDILGIFFPGAY